MGGGKRREGYATALCHNVYDCDCVGDYIFTVDCRSHDVDIIFTDNETDFARHQRVLARRQQRRERKKCHHDKDKPVPADCRDKLQPDTGCDDADDDDDTTQSAPAADTADDIDTAAVAGTTEISLCRLCDKVYCPILFLHLVMD